MIEGAFMFLIFACGAAAGFIGGAVLGSPRGRRSDIFDWEDEAYEPRRQEPRAVTRITSTDIDWEIK